MLHLKKIKNTAQEPVSNVLGISWKTILKNGEENFQNEFGKKLL